MIHASMRISLLAIVNPKLWPFVGVAFRQLIPVPFKVRDCTSYADKGRPTWDQMEDLALPIRETSTAKTTGFIVSR